MAVSVIQIDRRLVIVKRIIQAALIDPFLDIGRNVWADLNVIVHFVISL
jgi:hypothetical protein